MAVGLVDDYKGWRQRRRLAITCQAAVELMTDYLEGAMEPKDRARFEQHLRYCPPCERILDQLRATTDVVARLDPEQLEPETRDRVIELYRSYHES
jgi:predicted anti-sigma-YlaC factor YlaD